MNEAQTLFRDAVLIIRNESDNEKARGMLMQSLKLNPQNEMGWLWLARTLEQPRQQMDCIERALKINPENEQAIVMRDELLAGLLKPKTTTQTTAAMPITSKTTTIPIVPPQPAPSTTPAPKPALKKITQTIPAPTVSTTNSMPAVSTSTNSIAPKQKKTQTLTTALATAPVVALDDPASDPRRTTTGRTIPARQRRELTLTEKRRIDGILDKANKLAENSDVEAAIEQWVKVLGVQDDHEEAMRNAVRFLSKLGYMDDAKELLWRAINNGTDHPSIYLTAIEIADREKDMDTADGLRTDVVRLPQANESVVITIADYYIRTKHFYRAVEILQESLESHPNSQKILVRLGDLYQENHKERDAAIYYDRAAQLGTGTKEGKAADKKMKDYVPIMTDNERGSLFMAWREAFGFGVAFLLLAFQDAGLNFLRLGLGRWIGVGLGIVGGYLLITATSSPQQRGLAKLFGGHLPGRGYDGQEHGGVIQKETELPIIPVTARVVLGVIGGAIIVGGFALVFSTALHLITHQEQAYVPTFCNAIVFQNPELNRMIGC